MITYDKRTTLKFNFHRLFLAIITLLKYYVSLIDFLALCIVKSCELPYGVGVYYRYFIVV